MKSLRAVSSYRSSVFRSIWICGLGGLNTPIRGCDALVAYHASFPWLRREPERQWASAQQQEALAALASDSAMKKLRPSVAVLPTLLAPPAPYVRGPGRGSSHCKSWRAHINLWLCVVMTMDCERMALLGQTSEAKRTIPRTHCSAALG